MIIDYEACGVGVPVGWKLIGIACFDP